MKRRKYSITLRLPEDTVRQIDDVRELLRMNRTQWLRKAVARNLDHNRSELRVIDREDIRSILAS